MMLGVCIYEDAIYTLLTDASSIYCTNGLRAWLEEMIITWGYRCVVQCSFMLCFNHWSSSVHFIQFCQFDFVNWQLFHDDVRHNANRNLRNTVMRIVAQQYNKTPTHIIGNNRHNIATTRTQYRKE
mmetsp:Transcript_23696/g.66918  ORF Transcript_23696/g.66918 Transcript_23696/m.66918 type:complete len:126 (+) Transcript_23696:269-646(+)